MIDFKTFRYSHILLIWLLSLFGWCPQSIAQRYPCDKCENRSYSTNGNLKQHQRECHSGKPKIKCTYKGCTKEYTRTQGLQEHIRRKHEGKYPQPQVCNADNCSTTFYKLSNLKRHMRFHCPSYRRLGSNVVKCKFCQEEMMQGFVSCHQEKYCQTAPTTVEDQLPLLRLPGNQSDTESE
jgi:hypothetical protein